MYRVDSKKWKHCLTERVPGSIAQSYLACLQSGIPVYSQPISGETCTLRPISPRPPHLRPCLSLPLLHIITTAAALGHQTRGAAMFSAVLRVSFHVIGWSTTERNAHTIEFTLLMHTYTSGVFLFSIKNGGLMLQ